MEKISGTKSVFYLFYILCENFSKIGPIIKKIPNFVNDFLKSESILYLCYNFPYMPNNI